MIRMKALRSFGFAGVNEGKVRRGREFTAGTPARAKELEEVGLAFRLKPVVPMPSQIMPEERTDNPAASAGPLDSPGGTTGADAPVPSSPQDLPQRRGRRSRQSGNTDLLS